MKKLIPPRPDTLSDRAAHRIRLFFGEDNRHGQAYKKFEELLDPDIRPPFKVESGWFGQTVMSAVHQAM